jgi:hypothetical protein
MAAGLVDAIWRGWRDPRGAMRAQVAIGLSEPRALFHLTLACALLFVASLPNAVRTARGLDIADPVEGAVAAHLFGWMAVAPLLAYALAAAVHLAARAFGGRGGFLGARAALFWSALLAAPLALALAAVGVAVEAVPALAGPAAWLGYAAAGFGLWLFAASLAEAEGFPATARVAAAVAVAAIAAAGLVEFVARGTVA